MSARLTLCQAQHKTLSCALVSSIAEDAVRLSTLGHKIGLSCIRAATMRAWHGLNAWGQVVVRGTSSQMSLSVSKQGLEHVLSHLTHCIHQAIIIALMPCHCLSD